MKGISLPINVIVVVAVAVLVLIVVSAFFVTSTGGGIGSINTEAAYNSGCARLKQVDSCTTDSSDIRLSGYNPKGDPALKDTGDTLLSACRLKFNDRTMSSSSCKQSCGCSGTSSSSSSSGSGGAPADLGAPGAPGKFT